MLKLTLVCKSKGDIGKPTVITSDLIKAGFLKKKPKNGETVNLRLVNNGGITADQDFVASRDGNTLYAKNGFNTYLFDAPKVGKSVTVGCVGLVGAKAAKIASVGTSAKEFEPSSDRSAYTSLKALNKLLSAFPTKVAAAASIGVSVDTLRRMISKATAAALSAAAAPAKKQTRKASSSKKKAVAVKVTSSKPLMTLAKSGGYSAKQLISALKQSGGVKSLAAKKLGTNPRTFGRWLEAQGLA